MSKLKVALVHDYLKEYGGAERVLEALTESFPDAPIYTAFYKEGSPAYERLKHKQIKTSWAQQVPGFATKLHSPLRFLAPQIWGSFDFSKYDVIIGSSSWYVTKGFPRKGRAIEICYCHTPPRWLYGYKTSVEWQKFWPIKMYGQVIGHVMRQYDFDAAQKVDHFIANSKEVQARIQKFYRRDATVIYPPVSLGSSVQELGASKKGDYYFIVSRIVGAKGIDMAIEAARKHGFKLKIAGASAGYYTGLKAMQETAPENVEFLGHVSDEALVKLYAEAKAFIATATDEDFGITPVESMLCGTPVIAYFGGGFKETVIDGKTGVFFRESNADALVDAVKKFEKLKLDPKDCKKQAEKFSKERFIKEIKEFVKHLTA
jgi:glycosyltransferase involved in cell wall biosynthesis